MKECDYCKICGGFVDYDKSKVLYSYPSQYKGQCRDCCSGVTEYCHIVDEVEDEFIRSEM
jgi:hypothetical protein